MLKKIIVLLYFIALKGFSQESFPYERVLSNPENYNYYEISAIQEKDHFTLSGTLITPKTNFEKIIAIVPGSGKDTRNCHFILAEDLLKNNIAVFRYDERALGKSKGEYSDIKNGITSKSWDLYYLIKELQQNEVLKDKKMGLIGHSEGGMITIGAIEKGLKVDYLLQWAAPVQKYGALFKYQIKSGINKQERNLQYPDDETKIIVMDSIDKIIEANPALDNPSLKKIIIKSLKDSGYKEKQFGWYITFPTYIDILRNNSEPTYKNIDIPMLYIIATGDKHVDPISNVNLLTSFHNPNIEIKVFEGLNHYLNYDELKIRSQNMYIINEEAEKYMINWILIQK